MNNFLQIIYKVDLKILYAIFVPLGIIGNTLFSWKFLIIFTLVLILIACLRFLCDKKWLSDADKYVRIVQSNNKEPIWKTILMIILLLVLATANMWIPTEYLPEMPENFVLSFVLPIGVLSYGDYFVKFVESIKSFDQGIQLPGRKSELIAWKNISHFILEEKVKIKIESEEHEFYIDRRDKSYMIAIISDWESKINGELEN